MKNIVLVHGGFVDGAGWEGVYQILRKQGYNVSVVQNPTISLQDDVKVTTRILAAQDGPAKALNGVQASGVARATGLSEISGKSSAKLMTQT